MSSEEDYFKNKKTGWTKSGLKNGVLVKQLTNLSSSVKELIEQNNKQMLETAERIKNVLEKSTDKNTNNR